MTNERRSGGGISVSLVLFALVAVLVYIEAVARMPLWWAIVAGIALVGAGIGAFADVSRRRRR